MAGRIEGDVSVATPVTDSSAAQTRSRPRVANRVTARRFIRPDPVTAPSSWRTCSPGCLPPNWSGSSPLGSRQEPISFCVDPDWQHIILQTPTGGQAGRPVVRPPGRSWRPARSASRRRWACRRMLGHGISGTATTWRRASPGVTAPRRSIRWRRSWRLATMPPVGAWTNGQFSGCPETTGLPHRGENRALAMALFRQTPRSLYV